LLFLVFRGMTGCIWQSAFVATIFAIHPMRVESVAWIAERKDVLSGVFFMLTLGAYLRYVRAPGISRYLTLTIFLACGLMSKATFVAVPLVLLLLDYWPLGRSQKSEVRGQRSEIQIWLSLIAEKIPLLALAAAASVATVFAQTARADRFTYLPNIGITMLVTWACADLTQQWRHRRIVLISMATFTLAASTVVAYQQTTFWRNSISLWEHALAVTPDNQTAHQNLAAALWSKGRTAEANKHSRAAAIAHARTTLKDYPFDVATHNDLGVLLVQNGDVRAGIEQWKISLQIDPDDGNALNNLAWVLATYPADTIRDGKRAVELAEKAAVLPGGEAPIVLRTLAAAYAEAGDFSNAVNTAQHALDLATGQNNTS